MDNPRYPVVIQSESGEAIARINPDHTWSVKWPQVIDQAYRPLNDCNVAVCAICHVLIAGRDNFRTSSWTDVQPWPHIQFVIEPLLVASDQKLAMALIDNKDAIACVNMNGQWSVDWPAIAFRRANPLDDSHSLGAAVSGFCELLMAAKDNFHTQPMSLNSP